MKVITTQQLLAKALAGVSRVVNPRGTLSVLGNVLLETKDGRLKISGTNLEIGIDYFIGAKIESEGATTVPARLLTDYINNLSEEKVELNLNENMLEVKSTGSQSSIATIPATEFPLIPEVTEGKSVSISSSGIKDIIAKVAIAAAHDDTRPILGGVLFHFDDPVLKVAATDSYRLAELTMRFEKNGNESLKVVVPARALSELGRIIDDQEVTIRTAENQVQFETEHIRLVSRLLEGEFPNYTQIIPEKLETKAVLTRDEFAAKLKIASLFAADTGLGTRLTFTPPGKVEIASEAAQLGDSRASLSAEVSGPENTVSFNARYILDALGAIHSDKITFETAGKLSPGLITGDGVADYLYVIMPLRV